MAHANARLTVHGRRLLVDRILAGHRAADVAHQLGCSRATAYKWLAAFVQRAPRGLVDRPSRPHRCPHRTPRRPRRGSSGAAGPSPRSRLDRRRARDRALDGRPGDGAPPHARACRELDTLTGEPVRRGPASRRALRARAPGRAGAHRRQEARADPRGRRLARPRARHRRGANSDRWATTTCTRRSTTTHGWPTRRSILTSAGRPAPASWPGRPASSLVGIARIERVMSDNALNYRHSRAFQASWRGWAHATS